MFPGETLRCHVSLVGDDLTAAATCRPSLVRVVGFDADARSEVCEPIPSSLDGSEFVARVEATRTGSYAQAPLHTVGAGQQVRAIRIAFQATREVGSEQALMSLRDSGGDELTLALDAELHPLLIAESNGLSTSLRLQRVELDQWHTLTASLDEQTNALRLRCLPASGADYQEASCEVGRLPRLVEATVSFAARSARSGGTGEWFFTGRLEDPIVAASEGSRQLESAEEWREAAAGGDLLAWWDFGISIDSFELADVSGRGQHGSLHGVPQRAVTGSCWDGQTPSLHAAPEQYRAAHFWADAIEDAGWPAAVCVDLPKQLRSGVYGIRLETAEDIDIVPFVVAPKAKVPAEIALLLPTATYMAYSNARFTWEKVNWEVQRDRGVKLGRSEQILLDHPELGASSYDQYLDGNNITLVSWLRPNLDMRSAQRREENYPSDLHLIAWLEEQGYRYDVITDHDLDQEGVELLGRYRLVVTGTHPEYVSSRSVSALEQFVSSGGRLAVLGGNVFHYLVAFSSERPWLMEVRKPWNRPRGTRAAAEGVMALTGENGAAQGPRPGEPLLGTSTASMGFDGGRPYERLAESHTGPAAFVFDGLEADTIGDGGPASSVVHQEWDNTEDVEPDQRIEGFARLHLLARSRSATIDARWFGATKQRNRAEMTLSTFESGGAVFSVASMAWCLCLAREDVSRVTRNVVNRFLDPAPVER